MHIPHVHTHRILGLKSEIREVYLNQIIQTFALSLIGVFIPIYLLKLGFDLNAMLAFMAVYFLALGGVSPIAARAASKIGLKHTILYRLPMLIAFYILLMLTSMFGLGFLPTVFILAVALIGGASDSFYWVSLNSEFVKNCDKMHEGEEVGNLIALPKIAAIVAPLLGAIVLETMGFNTLFTMAIILLLASVAPLFVTGDMKTVFRFKLGETRLRPRSRIERKFATDFLLRGSVFMVETVLWPIWIFIKLSSLLDVGLAVTISGLGIAFITLVMGRASDRTDKIRLMKACGFLYSVVWFLRIFLTGILEIFILSFLGGVFMAAVALTMFASFCNFARDKNTLSSVVFREMWLNMARIIPLLVLLTMVQKFEFAFGMAGILSLLFLLI